jgi:ribosomal protein L6P/L9E
VAGWDSRYRVADPAREHGYISDSDYTECVLRDLSMAGVGFRSVDRQLAVGDRVVLDLRLGERHRASIRVTGEVRHAAPDDNGVINAGVEFVEVGALERALLLRLVRDLEQPRAQTV